MIRTPDPAGQGDADFRHGGVNAGAAAVVPGDEGDGVRGNLSIMEYLKKSLNDIPNNKN